jgi:hypothetical protein
MNGVLGSWGLGAVWLASSRVDGPEKDLVGGLGGPGGGEADGPSLDLELALHKKEDVLVQQHAHQVVGACQG